MGTSPSVLFVAHGSPMAGIEPGAAGAALDSLAKQLARPRAVLVISPHWETRLPTVGTTEAVVDHRLETIHDFGGFDRRLYEIQ
jgi:4,5-DOPA dioxygenase extradiol